MNCVWSETSLDPDNRSHYAIATLVNNALDRAGLGFVHRNGFAQLPGDVDGAVVIIHGGHQASQAQEIVDRVARLGWAISIIIGDEEGAFSSERLRGSRKKVWVQMPIPGVHDHADRRFICGAPHDAGAYLEKFEKEKRNRPLDWFFGGQINHAWRQQMVAQLRMCNHGFLFEAPSFWYVPFREEYYQRLASCKIAPCPAGAATPDTLRVAEALEAGCVPIVEDRWPPFFPRRGEIKTGYWQYVLGEPAPFLTLTSWHMWPELFDQALREWPANRDRLQVWWAEYKQRMRAWLLADISAVRG